MHGFAKLSFHELQDRVQRDLGAGPDVHGFSWIIREGLEQRTPKVEGDSEVWGPYTTDSITQDLGYKTQDSISRTLETGVIAEHTNKSDLHSLKAP